MLRRFGFQNHVALRAKHASYHLAQRNLIFYYQDRFGTASELPSNRRRRFTFGPMRRGKVNLERGAVAHVALQPNTALVLFHNSVNSRESQTRAPARLLRRKERLKDRGSNRRIDAVPR